MMSSRPRFMLSALLPSGAPVQVLTMTSLRRTKSVGLIVSVKARVVTGSPNCRL